MPEIDGTINGVHVKVIFKSNEKKSQWFAKPNNHLESGSCPNCPHFVEYYGELEVHEDSTTDPKLFRKMYPDMIASGSWTSGRNWASNQGRSFVVLPMEVSGNNFAIVNTASGSTMKLNADSWCVYGIGVWGPWEEKTPKRINFTEWST